MKKIFTILSLIGICGVMAQTPHTDPHWIRNDILSDEFDGFKKNIWKEFSGLEMLGSAFPLSDNIQYGNDNGRDFLRFFANVENGNIYSGGLVMGPGFNGIYGLGYGYYEVEARVLQTPNIVSGIYPAFWMQQGNNGIYPYWYEELDIFEVNNCEVRTNKHHVHYWYYPDEYTPKEVYTDFTKYNVDMSQWHKYAVEWLPERVTFYLDNEAFFVIGNEHPKLPWHQNTSLRLGLAIDNPAWCYPYITINRILGYYDVNYFRYHQLKYDCKTVVTQISNFNTYDYAVKKSISLNGTTTIPANANITLRATDYIELQPGFSVDTGRVLYLDITPCAKVARAVETQN